MINIKSPSYPLVTVDPYFSIWSPSDKLEQTKTRHWTGRPSPIAMAVIIDGNRYPVCGFDEYDRTNVCGISRFEQTDLTVTPLSTIYTFESKRAVLEVTFTTPLLIERPDIMSRPVSYVEYKITKKDNTIKNVGFVFEISSECCVNDYDREVEFKKTDFSMSCGNVIQNPVSQSGDSCLIDWGYLHLCEKDSYVAINRNKVPISKTYRPYIDKPYLATEKKGESGVICIAYDEIKAIEYFGEEIDEYYTQYFDTFQDMVTAAKAQYPEIKKLCAEFDKKLMDEAKEKGDNYCNILSLAYRQAVSAHKLIKDKDGKDVFLSKENHSNGCIGTLDVTYPSIPLFLKYNPELVLGMLRPIIKYAQTDAWEFDFAPHDVGQYPLANGQVYGNNALHMQMPIEESGNMLLCVAAAAKYSDDKSFFYENQAILKKWADYLTEFGYDPGEQLCTDDFAGHLNHNCNLSIKAILGIYAYGDMSGDDSYKEKAKEFAKKWENEAKGNDGTRLTFDKEDSWSLKYNMAWDNLLGYNIFSDETKKQEIALYTSKLNKYGVPLDSRADYTKIDWLMWSTVIYDDMEYFNKVCGCIINMLSDTVNKVPMTDWYCTKTANMHCFQARSVVGGLFINLL